MGEVWVGLFSTGGLNWKGGIWLLRLGLNPKLYGILGEDFEYSE